MSHRIYHLFNQNTGENYFGVTGRPLSARVAEHCVGSTKALEDWDCERDPIVYETVGWRRSRRDASALAHELEREAAGQGHRVIQTGGI